MKEAILKNFAKFTEKKPVSELLFYQKETLTPVFSCEFSQIFKNSLLYRTAPSSPVNLYTLEFRTCFGYFP